MKLGVPISLGLHASVVGVGLIAFSGDPKPFEESRIIPIEIVTISKDTNISAAIRRPQNIEMPEAQDDVPMTLETPQQNAAEEAPDISEREEEVVEKTAEAIVRDSDITPTDTADIPAAEPTTPQVPAFDLDKLAGLVNKTRDAAPEANKQIALQSEQNFYRFAESARAGSGEASEMTLSEMDALQSAMYKCWRMPADARNPEKLVVTLDVSLLPDGFVEDVKLTRKLQNRSRDPGNPFWEVAEQRALRAVSQCAPYDFLPNERYQDWRRLTLNFAPQL
jgi:hypothetical protein